MYTFFIWFNHHPVEPICMQETPDSNLTRRKLFGRKMRMAQTSTKLAARNASVWDNTTPPMLAKNLVGNNLLGLWGPGV